jgi:hypothetical protein
MGDESRRKVKRDCLDVLEDDLRPEQGCQRSKYNDVAHKRMLLFIPRDFISAFLITLQGLELIKRDHSCLSPLGS